MDLVASIDGALSFLLSFRYAGGFAWQIFLGSVRAANKQVERVMEVG